MKTKFYSCIRKFLQVATTSLAVIGSMGNVHGSNDVDSEFPQQFVSKSQKWIESRGPINSDLSKTLGLVLGGQENLHVLKEKLNVFQKELTLKAEEYRNTEIPESTGLMEYRDCLVNYLEWQSTEIPTRMREAGAVAADLNLSELDRRKKISQILTPITTGEDMWVKKMHRAATAASSVVLPEPPIRDSKDTFMYHFGLQAVIALLIMVGLGLAVFFIMKSNQTESSKTRQTTNTDPEDLY